MPSPAPEPLDLPPKGAARESWLDAARGIGIFLVVLGHTLRGLEVSPVPLDPGVFATLDAMIYSFHMPLFFVLAGMTFPRSAQRRPAGPFLRTRLSRLLLPMLLWTYIFPGFRVLAGAAVNHPTGMEELLRGPLPPYQHLWFLWALFLIQIAAFAGFAVSRRVGWVMLAALSVAGPVALALYLVPLDLIKSLKPALSHVPFFAFGALIGVPLLAGRWRSWLGWAGLAAFGASLALSDLAPEVGGQPPFLLSLAAAVGLILLVRGSALGRARWAATLGRASLFVYLAHTLFSSATRIALLAVGIDDVALHVTLGVAAGIAGPLLAAPLLRRTPIGAALGA